MFEITTNAIMPGTCSIYRALQPTDQDGTCKGVGRHTALYTCATIEGIFKPLFLPIINVIQVLVCPIRGSWALYQDSKNPDPKLKRQAIVHFSNLATALCTLGLYVAGGYAFLKHGTLKSLIQGIGVILGLSIVAHLVLASVQRKQIESTV